jgi:UDP-N-acetylmuramate dehydrogenase
MIEINKSLKEFNTFGIDQKTSFFIKIKSVSQLQDFFAKDEFKSTKKLILGGGSNILLLNDFDGVVIKIEIPGVKIVEENETSITIKVGAGVNWHQLVLHCVDNNWGGLENLSLIPGTVGAAPIQNIGAYGVEIKDTFESLEALNIETLKIEVFEKQRCDFGYRDSIFKQQAKGKYVILNVFFKLLKNNNLNLEYGAIKDTLTEMGIEKPTLKDVSNAVIAIRQSKLPDPAQIGNSGSFFKNPEVPTAILEHLKKSFPDIPSYLVNDTMVKIPAGWLIEKAGWKGYREGDAGVHVKQALVLVNYKNAKGQDIKNLSEKIQKSVLEKYGINILPEVNFIE